MLLIVAHHYVVNSGLMIPMRADPTSPRSLFLYLFGMWGKTGINCFVLITGYFMCRSTITLRKFLKLLLEVMFYHVFFFSLFAASDYTFFSLKGLAKALLPVRSIAQGFVGCFIVFFLCIPFLNILVQNMGKRRHQLLLLLALCVYTGMPFIGRVQMNYVTWFCVLYFISSYIRLYGLFPSFSQLRWGGIALGMVVLSMLSVVALLHLGASNPYRFVADSNAPLAVLTSVALFMFFKGLKMKRSSFINTVAASTFGVLLIHANSDAMRQWLWKDTLANASQYATDTLVWHALGSALGVFCVCIVIDRLRIVLLERPLFRLIDRWLQKTGVQGRAPVA